MQELGHNLGHKCISAPTTSLKDLKMRQTIAICMDRYVMTLRALMKYKVMVNNWTNRHGEALFKIMPM